MADRCTTADCMNPAEVVVSCEDQGYYPYCRDCAGILLLGGEELHPNSPPIDREVVTDEMVRRAYRGVYGDKGEPDEELFEHARAILTAGLQREHKQ